MAMEFAADGRVFVAEKSGRVKVFDSLTDTTPTLFAVERHTARDGERRACLRARRHLRLPGPLIQFLWHGRRAVCTFELDSLLLSQPERIPLSRLGGPCSP